ncbi:hypothetical protein EYF80_015226 [Liparis tanakae]|uniref:Uncharacterized protein n=1 Tax=Liparis tanakae TaxID=230148 RepID=A0A4Z2I8U4_9TELE|nr:hypothetical protein EYF80_015226 [Liparis tanakae]
MATKGHPGEKDKTTERKMARKTKREQRDISNACKKTLNGSLDCERVKTAERQVMVEKEKTFLNRGPESKLRG